MQLKNFRSKLIESFIGNVSLYALNLLFPFTITRIYGIEILGDYTYNITIISIALFLANLGMDTGLLYYIPKTGKKYVSAAFLINIVTSLLAITVLYLFMSKEIKPYLGLVWLLSAEQLFFSIYRANHHIKEFFRIKSYIGILGMIILSALFFKFSGANINSIILANYITVIISILFYLKSNYKMFSRPEIKKEFITYSVTIILGGVMAILIQYIDIVMIKMMIGTKDVGLYKVGTELALLPSIFLTIINTIFPPLISKLYHEGNTFEVRKLYEKLTRYLFLFSTITIVIILTFYRPILLLYGEEYLAAKNVLIYRALGQLVNASVGSVWYIITMMGHPKYWFAGVTSAAIINVISNYLLIPTMGIDGAAIASMTALIFVNILGYIIVKKLLKSKVYFIF